MEKSINKPLIKNHIFNISRPFQLTLLTGFVGWPGALTARVWLQLISTWLHGADHKHPARRAERLQDGSSRQQLFQIFWKIRSIKTG